MGESNYTIGLLMASCLALLVAVVLTTVEITEYGGAAPSRTAAPASPAPAVEEAAEAPEEAVEEPAEEAVEEGEAPAEEAAEEGEVEEGAGETEEFE